MKNKYLSLNLLFNTDERYNNAFQQIKVKNPKYSDFKIVNNQIVHIPTKAIVVKKEDIPKILQDLYNNDANVLSKGIATFYKYVSSKYLNITRQECKSFLEKQKEYQITYNPNKVINKPIVEKFPNNRWQIDLIDLSQYASQNKQYRYIFNCIDIFSRKVWIIPLKKKEPKYTTDALKQIIEEEAKVTPNMIQTDLGGEFKSEFSDYIKSQNIRQVFNDSHTPNQNAIVERSNLAVRKILRALMLRTNKTTWYDLLPYVEDNINNQYHSSIKNTPNQVWSATNTKISSRQLPDTFEDTNPKLYSQNTIVRKAKETIMRNESKEFNVGDIVRIKMAVIFSNIRKVLKSNNSKQLVVTFTPQLFRIIRLIKSKNNLKRTKYLVENVDTGNVLQTKDGKKKYLFASDMILGNDDEIEGVDMEQALELNKVTISATDLNYM